MKKILIILFSGISGVLFAQHSLQSEINMFHAGDEIIKQQVEYKDPGRAGENVLWDFSQLASVNDEYALYYNTYNDMVITGMEHLTQYHYTLQNDSLLLWGFENQTTKLINRRPELLFKFPVNLSDRSQSYYYAHGKHGNRLELEAMGFIETEADACGMMILPSKDTLRNVLRTHTVKYIAETSQPISESYYTKENNSVFVPDDTIALRLQTDSVIFVVETFRWYEKGYRYPIFETVRSWEQYRDNNDHEFLSTAFFYPPQTQYYIADDEAPDSEEVDVGVIDADSLRINPWEGLTYNFYPNPVVTNLEIEIYMPKQANQVRMQLTDRLGRPVWEKDYGKWDEGIHTAQIFMSPFIIGEYVLNMWFDEYLAGEKILKR